MVVSTPTGAGRREAMGEGRNGRLLMGTGRRGTIGGHGSLLVGVGRIAIGGHRSSLAGAKRIKATRGEEKWDLNRKNREGHHGGAWELISKSKKDISH